MRIPFFLALVLMPGFAHGALVTYSWSGTIFPTSSADVFGLGGSKPFEVAITVDTAAIDQQSAVATASFAVQTLSVKIDGIAASTVQSGILFFQDNDFGGSFESLSLQGAKITYNGATGFYNAFAALPDETTFAFTMALESLPVFTSRAAVGSISADGYQSNVQSGITVVTASSVPEPATIGLWALGACFTLCAFRRRSIVARLAS